LLFYKGKRDISNEKPLTQEELQALLIGVLPVNFPNINEQSLENVQDRAILTSLGIAAAIGSLISSGVNIWGQYFRFQTLNFLIFVVQNAFFLKEKEIFLTN
jgi:hypothetical protein